MHALAKKGRKVDHLMAGVVAHPLRISILRDVIRRGPTSPARISRSLGEDVSNVAYHVRVLRGYGLLVLTSIQDVRGAKEHFYIAAKEPVEHPVIQAALGLGTGEHRNG